MKHPIVLFWILVVSGITDVLDGYLARKLQCESTFGSRLDSLGDFLLFCALTWYVARYQTDLIQKYWGGILGIFLIRLLALLICKVRNHSCYVLHTYSNKATGFLVIVAICLLLLTGSTTFIALLLLVCIASAIEELLIMCLYKNPDINIKSIFLYKKKHE